MKKFWSKYNNLLAILLATFAFISSAYGFFKWYGDNYAEIQAFKSHVATDATPQMQADLQALKTKADRLERIENKLDQLNNSVGRIDGVLSEMRQRINQRTDRTAMGG